MIDAERLLAETDWLRALAHGLAGPAGAAADEDLCQDTLVAALERQPPARDGLRPWLASVARRLAAQARRGRARRARREHAAARHEALPSAAELVQQAELQRLVVDAVLQLEEPYRETVMLRFWHGLSTRELAAHHGLPIETARTRLKRALAMLRARLDRRLDRRPCVLAVLGGVLTMGVKAKLVGSLAAGVIVALATWQFGASPPVTPPAPVDRGTEPPAAASADGGLPAAAAGRPRAAAHPWSCDSTAVAAAPVR